MKTAIYILLYICATPIVILKLFVTIVALTNKWCNDNMGSILREQLFKSFNL